jgi:cell pole-organizing protein PopZ
MEDILASIRKILNEDDAGKAPGEATAEQHHVPSHEGTHPDDVLMLDESMMVSAEPLALQAPAEGGAAPPPASDPVPIASELVPMPVPMPPGPVRPEPVPPAPAPPDLVSPVPLPPPVITTPLATPLVGPAAAGAASGSVEMLMRTLARERTTATHRGGPTIEDLVREEMRPLLREWLDTHLPPLVERLVRTEIERVVNRMSS